MTHNIYEIKFYTYPTLETESRLKNVTDLMVNSLNHRVCISNKYSSSMWDEKDNWNLSQGWA